MSPGKSNKIPHTPLATVTGTGIEREYYSAAELEQLTGISENTWYFYAWKGTGPASFKCGRRRLWRISVVNEWLAAQEQAGANV